MPRDHPEQVRSHGSFDPSNLDRTIISIPLLNAVSDVEKTMARITPDESEKTDSIIFLSRQFPGGLKAAAAELSKRVKAAAQELDQRAEFTNDLSQKESNRENILSKNEFHLQGFDLRKRRDFVLAQLDRAMRLSLTELDEGERFSAIDRIVPLNIEIVIDLNLRHPEGVDAARRGALEILKRRLPESSPAPIDSGQYIFTKAPWDVIRKIVILDTKLAERFATSVSAETKDPDPFRCFFRIWPNFPIRPCLTKSVATVKADAAQASFSSNGHGITWAVVDSGIDGKHPHFTRHRNIDPDSKLHRDFTPTRDSSGDIASSLVDGFGHGTHVAGIIAGEFKAGSPSESLFGLSRQRSEREVNAVNLKIGSIRSTAPECQLVSLKVLDNNGFGDIGNVIMALQHVREANGNGGPEMRIHGVNISLGYEFDPEWFACGESPLCLEVNRLVRTGVVVVIAAGNTGYGTLASSTRNTKAGLGVTINDPGNAENAITVGSTHRDMPHRYGVSYFSSKGPTGDGRPKPDLVAPGEKILSCATGDLLRKKLREVTPVPQHAFSYLEESGTSMAAPHVSGVIAGFLSVRREFIGQPERIKEIFMNTATDLRRDRYFQGAGLVDLMRAIQSV